MQHLRESAVFGEEESQHKHITQGDPEAELGVVFVLLHEEVGSVAQVEIGHDDGQRRNGKQRCAQLVEPDHWGSDAVTLATQWRVKCVPLYVQIPSACQYGQRQR